MTTGSRILDTQVTKSLGCGSAKVGALSSRVWSGPDGKFRPNPYDCTYYAIMEPQIKWTNKPVSQNWWFSGTLNSCFNVGNFGSLSQNQLDALRTRVLKGVMGKLKRHDFNAAIWLGELPEAVRMVAEPVAKTLQALYYCRKGKFSKAERILFEANGKKFKIDKSASNNWLALRYGWIPLISDAYSAAEAYQTHCTTAPSLFTRVRSVARLPLYHSSDHLVFAEAKGYYSVSIILREQFERSIPSTLGFDNPALLVYELLPWSFVLDWAYDVGSWLELVTTLPRGKGAEYVETHFIRTHLSGPVKQVKLRGYTVKDTDSFYVRQTTVKRTVSSYPFVPPPVKKNPFGSSVKRFFDMLALANSVR